MKLFIFLSIIIMVSLLLVEVILFLFHQAILKYYILMHELKMYHDY